MLPLAEERDHTANSVTDEESVTDDDVDKS